MNNVFIIIGGCMILWFCLLVYFFSNTNKDPGSNHEAFITFSFVLFFSTFISVAVGFILFGVFG